MSPSQQPSRSKCPTRILARCAAVLALCLAAAPVAALDLAPLQSQLDAGRAQQVRDQFDLLLKNNPGNPHLLYNRAVASYAGRQFEEALLDLDQVENGRFPALAAKASFQKGNAEFRLGLEALPTDLDATLSRWKQSVASFERVLTAFPTDGAARTNHALVRKRLFDLLLKTAKEDLDRGSPPNQPAAARIPPLRNAMERFHDASRMEPQNQEARDGEQNARDQLAKALAEEGTRKTLANNMVAPTPSQPPVMRPDVPQIREGVNMLEDAHALKPQDQSIARQLDQGRERLADALALQAALYQSLEPRIQRVDDKLGVLRMAMELAEKALEQSPKHALAQQTLEQVRKRLAEIHEQQGDQLSQESQNAPLEQQAQQLSQALDHFQQASSLQPQQGQLPAKAQQAQARLEDVLERLGDQLMKSPGGQESLEQQVMRLEGATQAFSELQSLKPSNQTAEKARQAGQQLGALRQMLSDRGQPQNPQPGQAGDAPMPTPQEGSARSMPMDSPPRLDTPGLPGPYQSSAMNRTLRDY